jgi:PAS domain S-box-containing protein
VKDAFSSLAPLSGGQTARGSTNEHPQPTEPRFFLPFRRLPIPIHSIGPDGLLLQVNEAWTTYTGHSATRAIGCSFAEFLDPPSASRYRDKAVPELIASVPAGESRSIEYRLIKSSGDVADIVLTSRPERDPRTGRFLHSLAVINDITARNRAETALRHTQKLEALGGLTSGVAHDFNNLLAVIRGSLELLARRLPADDLRAGRLVDAALQGATRGAALTARLLAFARQQELASRPLDPRALLASLKPLLTPLLGPTIELEEEFPEGLWTLRADPDQLELALLNLAANARDAMPDGGRLRVSARNAVVHATESAFIEAGPRPPVIEGAYVVLAIRDTGTGMDEAALARAAEPFFTTKGPGKGTGLGLSMVHGFALQSGGAIRLSSPPGEGVTAELWLPRTTDTVLEDEADESSLIPRAPASGPSNRRVLLVDDDSLVLAGTTAMFEELGFDTICAAASGDEALDRLRQDSRFDLMLTDYMMPGMSGVQLAGRVRMLYPSLPILLASGFTDINGVIGTDLPRLGKPYGLKDLSAALEALGLSSGRTPR